jgi:16S rRNA G966 N2-methylase RsmD
VFELADEVAVIRADARRWISEGPGELEGFDLALLDPPYGEPELLEEVTAGLVGRGWLKSGAVVVCEYERRRGAVPMVWPEALFSEACRPHGQTMLEFLRLQPHHVPSGASQS